MGMFKKAERAQAKGRVALIGPSGAGKTYTALRMAAGLGQRIAVVDTEHGSASKYADVPGLPPFDVLVLTRHHPEEYIKAIRAAEAEGYDVLIIDSLSHAWNGRDGALELVDREAKGSRDNSFVAWAKVTPLHTRLIDAITGAQIHVIATMRSKTEYALVKDERTGKTRPEKVGIGPVQRDGMEYEFDFVVELDATHTARVTKTRCASLDGWTEECPGETFGERIGQWLADGVPVQPTAGAWGELVAKVTAPRGALQTMLAIWRGEPNTMTRSVAIAACAERFLDVTTTAAEVANALDWAEQSDEIHLPADVIGVWRRALDERMAREQSAADTVDTAGDDAAWTLGDDAAAIEAERMEMADAE